MAHIPDSVQESTLSLKLLDAGLTRVHQGKVRDTFALPQKNVLLQVATERVSVFDVVLASEVPLKGQILTALSFFWFNYLQEPSHFLAGGPSIDPYLPNVCKRDRELQRSALAVRKQEVYPIEAIVRGYLTGSGWASYQKDGTVCGIELPEGLVDGSKLDLPIFTPSTKAQEGHDENITYEQMEGIVGEKQAKIIKACSLAVYAKAASYAAQHGVIIADTKLEWSANGLADEVLTPDSSRFWDRKEREQALKEGRTPKSFDKQFVRDWGKSVQTPFKDASGKKIVGINNLDLKNPQHLAFVDNMPIPNNILAKTTALYLEIFQRLTQKTREDFQKQEMGIRAN